MYRKHRPANARTVSRYRFTLVNLASRTNSSSELESFEPSWGNRLGKRGWGNTLGTRLVAGRNCWEEREAQMSLPHFNAIYSMRSRRACLLLVFEPALFLGSGLVVDPVIAFHAFLPVHQRRRIVFQLNANVWCLFQR